MDATVTKPANQTRSQHKPGKGAAVRHAKVVSVATASRPAKYAGHNDPQEREIIRLQLEATALRAHLAGLEGRLSGLVSERNHLARLFETSPVGDLILDAQGNILESNRQASLIVGCNPKMNLEGPFTMFVASEDVPEFLDHLRRCRSAHTPVSTELKIVLPRQKTRPVELLSTLIDGPDPSTLTFRTLLVDITQRAAAQAALQISQQNYRALIDSIEGIVWEADPRTLDIVFVSQSAERLLGYSTAVWYQPGFWGRHIHVADRERVLDQVTKALAKASGSYTVDYRMLDSKRRLVWVRDTLTVFTHQGKTRLLGVAVNITDRKELEDRLNGIQSELESRVRERTAELSTTVSDLEAFSYSISHDLRAPLRAMEGYAHLLQQRLGRKLDPACQDFLSRISASAQRLDSLIQDVLKYSRVARAPLEIGPIDLDKLVDGIIKDYPNLQPPKAEVEVRKPLKQVKGNEAFLTQCISNLLSNGVKFVKPGQHPRVRVWTQDLKDGVRLCFEDNGIGVAPENQHRIFGIFQRMHSQKEYEGTGIGLAIVKKAAERMGGRVGLESNVGKGSRFWLELPRA